MVSPSSKKFSRQLILHELLDLPSPFSRFGQRIDPVSGAGNAFFAGVRFNARFEFSRQFEAGGNGRRHARRLG